MTSFFSTQTQVALIDTRTNPGTIQLPAATTFAYRTILLKDIYGTFATKSLTLTTSGSDTFEDGSTSKVLTTNSGYIQVYAGQAGKWYILSGTDLVQIKVSSLQFSTILGPLPQLSTVSLFTSNTSNYYSNVLQNYSTMFSTAVSTVALFTSNTSNYYSNAIQNWSTPLISTTIGLGNIYLSTVTGGIATIPNNLSTMALFTSSASISTTTSIILSTQALYASSVQAFALSSQSLYVSSFYTATRQLTPMFITF
jgi:hypothetical protein